MAKKDFTITMFQDSMKEVEAASQFILPEHKDLLFFSLEGQPNLEAGDMFNARVIIDPKTVVNFEAVVEGICPPLMQPPTEDKFNAHVQVVKRFLNGSIVSQLTESYYEGKAQQSAWTIYFRKSSKA